MIQTKFQFNPTAKELIEALEKCKPEAIVVIRDKEVDGAVLQIMSVEAESDQGMNVHMWAA